jgi:hypothetical protein
MALFSSRDPSVDYQLPIPLPDVAVVGWRFHLKPLLLKDELFYILARSQNEVRLLQYSASL